MWNKPWKMAEGFAIGGGLIMAGLLLELSVGPLDWDAFAWPANAVTLGVFVLLILCAYLLRKRFYAFRFIGSLQAAIPALVYAVILTVIMGLTRQTVGGSWLNSMLTFWPFVLIYVYMAFILGLVILRHLHHFSWKRDIPFLLNHLGLFIALTCATLGNADMQRLKMITAVGEPEWRALSPDKGVVELPIAIELKRFVMEEYDDGTPKRFASDIEVFTQTGKNYSATVDVNHPAEVEGWKVYQFGYDTQMGAKSRMSILELVRDPWLPSVYTGIFMMLLGAVCMFVLAQRRR